MEPQQAAQIKPLNPLSFSLLAVLAGLLAGLGAVIFRGLIAFVHNLLFLGKFSLVYEANVHTAASPWGPLVILVPVLGAVGVAFLVKNFAPAAKGTGAPEVLDAIYYHRGLIRPHIVVIKSLAAALSLGSGGSVGREGPIIQIGGGFGAILGQYFPMPAWQRITLVTAGTAGGIAATFNAPVGGVLFALEVMLHEVSVRTLVPVAIATATATYIGRAVFGNQPSFILPGFAPPYSDQLPVLLAFVGLGIIGGGVSALLIKSIYGFEDFFEQRIRGNYYTRHVLGMLLVGVVLYLLLINLGHYYVEGVGYATVQDILSGTLTQFWLLLLLLGLKLGVTSLALGSGASGGIFSPALYVGATLGGAYGIVLDRLVPGLLIDPAAFAVAGMAGMVGGTTGAAIAGIVMLSEMTLDYRLIIPTTLTVALSYGVRKLIISESIYTLKLVRRGHDLPQALQSNFQYLKRARTMMETSVGVVSSSSTLQEFARTVVVQPTIAYFLVEEQGVVRGIIAREAALKVLEQPGKSITVGEIATADYVTVTENSTFFDILTRMRADRAAVALVGRRSDTNSVDNVQGLITKSQIVSSMEEAVELFTS